MYLFGTKINGETETISSIFHWCQNCRKTSGCFWQQFQPKMPVPGSCHRETALQDGTLLEQAQKYHLAFIILFLCQPRNLSIFVHNYAIPKCKSKGSGLYATGPVSEERLSISRVADLPGYVFRQRKISLLFPMAWDEARKANFIQFPGVHFHRFQDWKW